MSDAKPPPSGPERRWRQDQPSEFKKIERKGRIVLLAFGAVVLASLIIGTFFWWGTPTQTHLYCYPYGSYANPQLAPAPWFFQDADQLLKTFGFDQKNIRTKLERRRLLDDLPAIKDETIILYIAGRGMARNQQAYVLPSDATDEPGSWIPLEEIIKKMADCPSLHKLLLLDIASTAPNLYTGPLQDNISDAIDDYLTMSQPPFPVLTSCSKGETSNVMAVTGSSVFGYYLNQGMQGLANGFGGGQKDEMVTVKELISFVNTRVNRWSSLNLGRTQTPKSYGPQNMDFLVVHRRKVAWLDEPPKAAETPALPDESKLSDKEKLESKAKRDQQQKEIDQTRLSFYFPKRLEAEWKPFDAWNSSLLPIAPRRDEYPLRLATLNRLARQLRQHEETVMLFNTGATTDQSPENQSLNTSLNKSANDAKRELTRIDRETQRARLPNSITALWPRSWLQLRTGLPRAIPRELASAYDKLYQSVPGSASVPAKDEPKPDDKPFLELVSGKKEKDEKNAGPSYQLEAVFLCWDTLCEDPHLTLDRLKFAESLLKKLLGDALRDKLNARCNELELLRWIIEQSEGNSSWNFISGKDTNRDLQLIYLTFLHQWLMLEYYSERCANAYHPDGIGFENRPATWEPTFQKHMRLNQDLLKIKKSGNQPYGRELVLFSDQMKAMTSEYAQGLKDLEKDRAALDAWWDAVAVLQATAEMMVSESDTRRWLMWEKLAIKTLKLRRLLQAKSHEPSDQVAIEDVLQARKELLESFNSLIAKIQKNGYQAEEGQDLRRDIERVLKSNLLTTTVRKNLHEILMKLQDKQHTDTVNIEREDDKGKPLSTKPGAPILSSEAEAKRRATISRLLLLIGGSTAMEKSVTAPTVAELRKAWTQEMPQLLKETRMKEQWLEAARIEAVLPLVETTDALLQWRLKHSKRYHHWLEEQDARQLLLNDQWK